MKITFWLSLLIILYMYLGYPLCAFLCAKITKKRICKNFGYMPFVSVVISVHNEEKHIEKKIQNILESRYPSEKIKILIGSDGSDDDTNDILLRMLSEEVGVFIYQKREGKASVLNRLMLHAKGEIAIFCDARQIFDKDAIRNLVANFSDKKVGCVSGELVFVNKNEHSSISEGVGIYWKYEKFIRKNEAEVHSMIGATGAIYAIRKKLYSPIPANTILDDVYIPLAIVRKNYRCLWDETAIAYDRPAVTSNEEYKRKVRTLAGNYQIFGMFKDLFNPFKNVIAIPFFSHKLLRVMSPFFLISLFASNIFIAQNEFYGASLIFQVIFYMFAIIGGIYNETCDEHKKLLTTIAGTIYSFGLMNYAALVGCYRFLFSKQSITWKK
jgi:biofilm PGA synthesis N-glycosyltransferase PgaC